MPRNVLWVSSTDNNGLAKSPRDERLRFQLWWISQSQARPQFFGMLPGLKLDHEDNKGYSVYEFHHDFTWQLHYTEIILQSLKERRFKLGTTRQRSFRSQSHKRPWYARRSVLSEQEIKCICQKLKPKSFQMQGCKRLQLRRSQSTSPGWRLRQPLSWYMLMCRLNCSKLGST